MAQDPRLRRPVLEAVPWHRDSGLLGPVVAIAGVCALVFGILFADQLLSFIRGIDLETRLPVCSAEATGACATVTKATVMAVNGDTLSLEEEGGARYSVTGTSGAPASAFHPGETVDTVSAGGPVAELKAGGTLLFTRYYEPEDPHYWQWQGAVFAFLALVFTLVYARGAASGALRSPRAILSDRRRQ